jgi:tryptophanase
MALFYTHVLQGQEWIRDLEGIQRRGLKQVEHEALEGARELLAADIKNGHLNLDGAIAVEDENGFEIHRLLFSDAVSVTGL